MGRRGSTKIRGLSKSISLHGFKGNVRYTKILRAAQQEDRLREIDERRVASLQGMSFDYCPPARVTYYLV